MTASPEDLERRRSSQRGGGGVLRGVDGRAAGARICRGRLGVLFLSGGEGQGGKAAAQSEYRAMVGVSIGVAIAPWTARNLEGAACPTFSQDAFRA